MGEGRAPSKPEMGAYICPLGVPSRAVHRSRDLVHLQSCWHGSVSVLEKPQDRQWEEERTLPSVLLGAALFWQLWPLPATVCDARPLLPL